eukprot:GHVN01018684.1.p3 GENE.GHVN01018684.1~~GHVN01018684.1.p3  ORF type:complete len:123 (-),score=7.47 GHVN01018684.1:1243-1611(-)
MRDRICLQAYLVGIIAIVGTTIVVFVLVPLINPEVHGSIPEMLVFKERSFKDGVVTELDARYRARAGEANEVSKEKIAVVACTKSMPEWKTLGDSAAMKILLPSLRESINLIRTGTHSHELR